MALSSVEKETIDCVSDSLTSCLKADTLGALLWRVACSGQPLISAGRLTKQAGLYLHENINMRFSVAGQVVLVETAAGGFAPLSTS